MKNVLLSVPCMLFAVLVLFPSVSKAYTFNDMEYASMTEFTVCSYGTVTDDSGSVSRGSIVYELTVYSTNPDAEIYAVHSINGRSNMTRSAVGILSVGADTKITCIVDGSIKCENMDLVSLDMNYLIENPSVQLTSIGSAHGVYSFFVGSYTYQDNSEPLPSCKRISGNVIDILYDKSAGNPTAAALKTALDNYDSSPEITGPDSDNSGPGLQLNLAQEVVAFVRKVMTLLTVFPLNVIVIASIIGIGFGVFRNARTSVM